MLDNDGDEDYKPMLIPIDGGYPKPAFEEGFDTHRFFLNRAYPEDNVAYFTAASHEEAVNNIIPLLKSELQKHSPEKIAVISEMEIAMKNGDIKKLMELRKSL